MIKMNKVAAMLGVGAAAMGCSAAVAFAAIPSPALSSVVEGQTKVVVTVTQADGAVVEQEFVGEVTGAVKDTTVYEKLGITEDVLEALEAGETPQDVKTADETGGAATAFSGIIIVPASDIAEGVRPVLIPQATVDMLEAMEAAIEETADDAQEYQAVMLESLIASMGEDLTDEEKAAIEESFAAAIAEVDPEGTAVLLANPRVIIVSEDNQIELAEGEEATIQITGFEIAGTTEESQVYLTLQYVLEDGTQQVDVVAPQIEEPAEDAAEDAPLTYTFEIPANVSYMVMTIFGQVPAEAEATPAA